MNGKLSEILIEKLRELQERIQERVLAGMRDAAGPDALSAVAAQGEDDTIYAIDKLGEEVILEFMDKEIRPHAPCLLVAEGISGKGKAFTSSGRGDDAEVIVIMDPIDGSRGLMHGKRSAWSLAGVAQNFGPRTSLSQIEIAVQTELPAPKQAVADQLWAAAGRGVQGLRRDLRTGDTAPLSPCPSRAQALEHGFATFNRFFPGVKDIIAEIEEEFARKAAGYTWPYYYFEDQYICSGGQLYELLIGHDRMVCDLRGLLAQKALNRGDPNLLCCHPYDLCTELIAREAGVVVARPGGGKLDAPLDTTTNVAWIAYANQALHDNLDGYVNDILLARKLI